MRLLLIIMGGYAALFGVLSQRRFSTFHAQIDMSYYLRLIWGLGHGRYDLPLVQAPHLLGLHLEPVCLPLALLSRLGVPMAPLLLWLQALAVAALAWPVHRLARRHLGERLAPACALLALLYPTVSVATLHDFHPVTLALAPLLLCLDALDEDRPRRAVLWGLLALSCREDIALQLALVALAAGRPGRWRGALLCAAALCAYFLIYILWVQPPRLPPSGSYTLHFPRVGGAAAHSAPELLKNALGHPRWLLGYLLSGDRPLYPLRLLWPLGLLPLLAPRLLLGTLPIAAINLLSDFPRVRTIEAHYTTALVPFLLAAAVVGAGRMVRALRGRRALAPLPLLLLAAHVLHGGSPLSLASERFRWALFQTPKEAPAVRQALARVPPADSVAAPPGILAHLCERPRAISPPEYDDGKPVQWTLYATGAIVP